MPREYIRVSPLKKGELKCASCRRNKKKSEFNVHKCGKNKGNLTKTCRACIDNSFEVKERCNKDLSVIDKGYSAQNVIDWLESRVQL